MGEGLHNSAPSYTRCFPHPVGEMLGVRGGGGPNMLKQLWLCMTHKPYKYLLLVLVKGWKNERFCWGFLNWVSDIVDKTASFVARNGPEFESRIRQNEIKNPKFNFLNAGDPYNAYYQHKVNEHKEGKGGKYIIQVHWSVLFANINYKITEIYLQRIFKFFYQEPR